MSEINNLSDLDLYDEARSNEITDYVIVPGLVRADEHMKWEVLEPTNWIVEDEDAVRQLALDQCWVCGSAIHYANNYYLRGGRIVVIRQNAAEAIRQAA